jgi:hypothetical protein
VNEALLRDLSAFAEGGLARDELLARHGNAAAAPVAVHERLGAMPSASFDLEGGWARVAAQIASPATVVALRAPRRRPRSFVLAVAAALMLAGSAFAAIGPRVFDGTVPVAPIVRSDHVPSGSEVRGRPEGAADAIAPEGTPREGDGDGHPTGSNEGAPTEGGSTTEGGNEGSGTPDNGDDPNDRDQGKGNDGQHDDHGGGNDGKEGSPRGGPAH